MIDVYNFLGRKAQNIYVPPSLTDESPQKNVRHSDDTSTSEINQNETDGWGDGEENMNLSTETVDDDGTGVENEEDFQSDDGPKLEEMETLDADVQDQGSDNPTEKIRQSPERFGYTLEEMRPDMLHYGLLPQDALDHEVDSLTKVREMLALSWMSK
jgi:hypothetical protein